MNEPASQSTAAPPRTVVLLCTFNEVDNLPHLFENLGRHLPQADILVVDDNSPDGTAQWVQSQQEQTTLDQDGSLDTESAPRRQIHLLSRPEKLGLGTATRDGLQWCMQSGYDFIINMDADLSHQASSTPALLAACETVGTDVAVGSRYIPGGGLDGLAWHRRLVSRLLNSYATRLLRLPVRDCSGAFRCYRVAVLRAVDFEQLTCPGYGFLEEILVALHRNGATLVEVPIRFQTRSGGSSKLGVGDALGAIGVIHRLAFASLFGRAR